VPGRANCYGYSVRYVKLLRAACRRYDADMILKLNRNDFLRLRRARGIAIQVLSGQVWITEDGSTDDRFLGAGSSYRVASEGLVLVGTETFAGEGFGAEIAISGA
jgi:hypothetical protein